MTLREELQAKKADLAALKERIEANDAEAIAEGEKLQAEIETKSAEVEQAERRPLCSESSERKKRTTPWAK